MLTWIPFILMWGCSNATAISEKKLNRRRRRGGGRRGDVVNSSAIPSSFNPLLLSPANPYFCKGQHRKKNPKNIETFVYYCYQPAALSSPPAFHSSCQCPLPCLMSAQALSCPYPRLCVYFFVAFSPCLLCCWYIYIYTYAYVELEKKKNRKILSSSCPFFFLLFFPLSREMAK